MFLKERFGLEVLSDELENVFYEQMGSLDDLLQVLYPYKEQIKERIELEKKTYKKYIKSLDLRGKIGTIDLWAYGTTQFYFNQFMKLDSIGYYFFVKYKDNPISKINKMKACFMRNEDDEWGKTGLTKYALFWESFFTAPTGMFNYVDINGEFVYSEKMTNQNKFCVRERMLSGIKEYFDDSIRLRNEIQVEVQMDDCNYIDQFCGLILDDRIEIQDFMKSAFFFDNTFLNHKESPIW